MQQQSFKACMTLQSPEFTALIILSEENPNCPPNY
nr:MAG TPA: hypothetical protein [Bacteriophage sp.]